MSGTFHLENVGQEEDIYASSGEGISGFGLFALTNERIEYHFRKEDMSLEEVESYIEHGLNRLPDGTVDKLCRQICEFKDHILSECYPGLKVPDGLAEAQGKDILRFLSVSDVYIYRNPYNEHDAVLGASVTAGLGWEFEDGMEIIIRGTDVRKVREYLGYGEFAIWDESDCS